MSLLSRRLLVIAAGVAAATALTAGALIATTAEASIEPGGAAPSFQVADSNGQARSLAEFRGRTVVLEWTNHQCPYVVKHYATGNMQALQREAAAAGVVWLTVISSAPGEQGHVSGAEANALTTSREAAPTAVLLDAAGSVGRAFSARTTPHMFVIDPQGRVAYQGAIDDNPSRRHDTVESATNHVRDALQDIAAGRPVATPRTTPYGCTVKYGS